MTTKDEKYYFVIDNSTQWFTFAIKATVNCENVLENVLVPNDLEATIISDILERDTSFENCQINIPGTMSCSFRGWSICRREYEKIKKIVELFFQFKEFKKLSQL